MTAAAGLFRARLFGSVLICFGSFACGVAKESRDRTHSKPDSGAETVDAEIIDAAADAGEGAPPPIGALPPGSAGACAFEPALPADFTTSNPKCPHGIYTGDLSLSDSNFADAQDCVRVVGTVDIVLNHRHDLSGLESLRVIEGKLNIMGYCRANRCLGDLAFDSLHGLDHLRCVTGDVTVGRTADTVHLTEIDGLSELVEVGGDLNLHVSGVKAADQLKSLRRVWGDVTTDAVLPLPALETIYGKLVPTPYRSDAWPAPAPALTYIGCSPDYLPCRDGFLGCAYDARSQSDVDRLASCERTFRGLTLSGAPISDLKPLAKLAAIGGDFSIGPESGDGELASLGGLDALKTSGALLVRNLPRLQSLRGLDRLATLDVSARISIVNLDAIEDLMGLGAAQWLNLSVSDNAALRSLDGLRAVESVQGIEIARNPELRSIAGFSGLRHAAFQNAYPIQLVDLPKLENLVGLGDLADGWSIYVVGCHALEDLTGLAPTTVGTALVLRDNAGLKSAAGWSSGALSEVSIDNSPQLTDLSALASAPEHRLQVLELARLPALDPQSLNKLAGGERLKLTHCDGLETLAGFDSLADVSGLVLAENAQLRNLTGAPQLKSLSFLEIDGNPMLTSLNGVPAVARLTLSVQNTVVLQDLAGLEGVAEVENLRLVNNAALQSLHGLSGVRALVTIDTLNGDIGNIVGNNPKLVSLDGLNALESADLVFVRGNAALERLGSFPNLHKLERLVIDGNPKLTSLAGMTALADDGQLDLELSDNATLTDLSGFDGVKHVHLVQISNNAALSALPGWHFETIDQGLLITQNPKLTSLSGSESLQRAGDIQIESNPKLTSLDGLSGLRTVDLWILLSDNPALVSLRAVAGVTSTGGAWSIHHNGQLPQCEIDQLFAHVPDASSTDAQDNGPPGVCTSW